MKHQPDFVQPPRVAAWLVTLFTPAEQSEAIVGDLLEEFSCLVSQSNTAAARSWYWRQAVKTVFDLVGTGFRSAPWLMCAAVAAGFFLIGFATRMSSHAMQVFLDSHRIYDSHPDAYLFWIKFPSEAGRVILCCVIGMLVAVVVKGKELTTTLSLAGVEMALFVTAAVAVIASGHDWSQWFLTMMPWNSLCALAIIAGGVIVRMSRSAKRLRPSVT